MTEIYIDKDNILWQKLEGSVTAEYMASVSEKLLPLAKQLKAKAIPVVMMVNAAGISGSTIEGRKKAIELIESTEYVKSAVFGLNVFMKNVANLIIGATGKGSKIKIFSNEAEALAWIKS